jgi:hypothetical protein
LRQSLSKITITIAAEKSVRAIDIRILILIMAWEIFSLMVNSQQYSFSGKADGDQHWGAKKIPTQELVSSFLVGPPGLEPGTKGFRFV